MSEKNGLGELSRPVWAAGSAIELPVRSRRGLRVALLSLATAILLLGAAVAAVFGYHAITNGSPSAAGSPAHHRALAP